MHSICLVAAIKNCGVLWRGISTISSISSLTCECCTRNAYSWQYNHHSGASLTISSCCFGSSGYCISMQLDTWLLQSFERVVSWLMPSFENGQSFRLLDAGECLLHASQTYLWFILPITQGVNFAVAHNRLLLSHNCTCSAHYTALHTWR